MSNFKVGDRVRCVVSKFDRITNGKVYQIHRVEGGWYYVNTDDGHPDAYLEHVFKPVQAKARVLTPEEVFKHLRKGTELEYEHEYKHNGYTVTEWKVCANPQFANILNRKWRIKPEPEVIELNGKRYKLIED